MSKSTHLRKKIEILLTFMQINIYFSHYMQVNKGGLTKTGGK